MEIRHTTNPTDVKQYTTERLRQEFLIESLFEQDRLTSFTRTMTAWLLAVLSL